MLIVGAKGFAKEVLEICHQNKILENLVFFDDINKGGGNLLFNKFPILKTEEAVNNYFKTVDNTFTIGIGKPKLRAKMYTKFTALGGVFTSVISLKSNIGNYDVDIKDGVIIMDGVNISNSVTIGMGTMIYYNSNITHDCNIGEFVEISPSVNFLGRVSIDDFSMIGSNATILPDVSIGKNVTVGAGAVVTRNFKDNCVIAGIPAKILSSKR